VVAVSLKKKYYKLLEFSEMIIVFIVIRSSYIENVIHIIRQILQGIDTVMFNANIAITHACVHKLY